MDSEEKDHGAFEFMLEDCRVGLDDHIPAPPVAISYGDYLDHDRNSYPLPIATYGNFVFIQAPPKSMKTFFVSLLVASFLGADKKYVGNIKGHPKGHEVLHIDTEQSNWHAQKVFTRVGRMVTDKASLDKYNTFFLREWDYRNRVMFIDEYLKYSPNTGLVVVDGIADLVSDVNDIKESSEITQKFMEWSSKHNCAIVTVIHSNWGSQKPTGHLGSFMEKKCETQISIEKSNNVKGRMVARHKGGRNTSFDEIVFTVDNGMPYIEELTAPWE